MYCRSSGEKRKGKLMKWLLIPLCIRSFQREYFIRRKNDDKKEGNGNDCEIKKKCFIGLEGWKIVFRFNYILFTFFPPRGLNLPTPPFNSLEFFFHVFLPFQFPLEWKSLEHYCNFFLLSIRENLILTLPRMYEYTIRSYTKWMDFFPLFVILRDECGKLLL